MAIEKIVLEKAVGGLSSAEEISGISWEKILEALETIKGKHGMNLVLFLDKNDSRTFLKIMGGPDNFSLLYTYTEDTLPDVMRDGEDSACTGEIRNAIWIVDEKGEQAAAKEYFERGSLYDSVEWEMI